jgi:hypothetical protein
MAMLYLSRLSTAATRVRAQVRSIVVSVGRLSSSTSDSCANHSIISPIFRNQRYVLHQDSATLLQLDIWSDKAKTTAFKKNS